MVIPRRAAPLRLVTAAIPTVRCGHGMHRTTRRWSSPARTTSPAIGRRHHDTKKCMLQAYVSNVSAEFSIGAGWSHANELGRIGSDPSAHHVHMATPARASDAELGREKLDGAEDSPQPPPGSHHHNHTSSRTNVNGPDDTSTFTSGR